MRFSLAGRRDAFQLSFWLPARLQISLAALLWAVDNGILNGDNGALKPGAPASRAEVAAMLMRFCEKMGL